jgi:hypothetical protein
VEELKITLSSFFYSEIQRQTMTLLIYCGIILIFGILSKILTDNPVIALGTTLISLPIFLVLFLNQDHGHWFIIAKRFSVTIPIVLWSYHNYSLAKGKKGLGIFAAPLFYLILFLNIFEVSVLEYISSSKIMAVVCFLFAISTFSLKWEYDCKLKLYGFDNMFWVTCFNSIIGYTYIFSGLPFFNLLLLILALVGSYKDGAITWMNYRAYSLLFFIMTLTVLPKKALYLKQDTTEIFGSFPLIMEYGSWIVIGINIILIGAFYIKCIQEKRVVLT